MTIAERLIQKGALEVAREIACRLRDMGWPPERIQEATGLSGEELKKLAVNYAHTSSAVSPSSFSSRLMISALRIPCM